MSKLMFWSLSMLPSRVLNDGYPTIHDEVAVGFPDVAPSHGSVSHFFV